MQRKGRIIWNLPRALIFVSIGCLLSGISILVSSYLGSSPWWIYQGGLWIGLIVGELLDWIFKPQPKQKHKIRVSDKSFITSYEEEEA